MTATSPVRVLVVEDETLLRLDLGLHLGEHGYDVLEAGSAMEAIEILEKDRSIRVVFTDIRMPGDMDGIALAKCVRERWPPTIIVICSANTSDYGGLADFHLLDKPYVPEKMLMVLDAVNQQLASVR